MSTFLVPTFLSPDDIAGATLRHNYCQKFQAQKQELTESYLNNDCVAAIGGIGLLVLTTLIATLIAFAGLPITFSALLIVATCVIGTTAAICIMAEYGRRSSHARFTLEKLHNNLKSECNEPQTQSEIQRKLNAHEIRDAREFNSTRFDPEFYRTIDFDQKVNPVITVPETDKEWMQKESTQYQAGIGVELYNLTYASLNRTIRKSELKNKALAVITGLAIFTLTYFACAFIAVSGGALALVVVGIVGISAISLIFASCLMHRYHMRASLDHEKRQHLHIVLIEKFRYDYFDKLHGA